MFELFLFLWFSTSFMNSLFSLIRNIKLVLNKLITYEITKVLVNTAISYNRSIVATNGKKQELLQSLDFEQSSSHLHNHFLIRNDGHLIIFDFNECSEFTVAITDEYFVLLDFQNRMNSANRNVGYFDITIMSSSLGLKIGITNMSRFLVNLMNTNKLSSVSNNIKSEASYYSPITSIIHPFYFENMRNVLLHISQINTFL